MIQLATSFVSGEGGFSQNPLTYTQLKRSDKAAVYSRSRDGKVCDYEVFLIKIDPKGKTFKFPNGVIKTLEDDTEKYPSSSQFGRIAWSYTSLGMANHRFHELTHGKVKEEPDSEEESSSDPVAETPHKEITKENKPYSGGDLLIPVGEFSTQELADKNNVAYVNAYLFVKDQERKGKVKFSRKERRNAKGKPTTLFQLVNP